MMRDATSESRRPNSAADVAAYYDRNTRRFLAFGGGSRSHAIHRALWGPSVTDAEQAGNYINVLLGNAIESLELGPGSTLLDLGCGVGGTMFALAQRFPRSKLYGVTISQRQAGLAEKLADRFHLESRCRFYCGDFESIDLGVTADVVIAVESMVHAGSLSAFLASAASHLAESGTLVIVDDFIEGAEEPKGPMLGVLNDFREGWRLSSLTTVPACVTAAMSAGFDLVESLDLSPMIRLRHRDRVIAAVGPLLRPLVGMPMLGNLVGGAALTRGLQSGTLGYRWLRLRRSPDQLDEASCGA